MRVVDVACPAGSAHQLELRYRLGQPESTGALPIALVTRDGVSWDLLMSDLEPGRYLEMWFPAGLCHDTLRIEVDVEVAGTDRPTCSWPMARSTSAVRVPAGAVRYPRHLYFAFPLARPPARGRGRGPKCRYEAAGTRWD